MSKTAKDSSKFKRDKFNKEPKYKDIRSPAENRMLTRVAIEQSNLNKESGYYQNDRTRY